MAVISIHNYCDYVQMAGVLQVVLPNAWVLGQRDAGRLPLVYLLAPEGEEGSRWLRHTQAELLAEQYQVAMVLVSSLQGCYTDMAYGYRFFQSLADGVPAYLKRNLPALRVHEGPCYIAGCSMGGMGAIKLALRYPARFAAVGSFSGRLDNADSFRHPVPGDWLTPKRMVNLWGSPEAIHGSQNDLHALAAAAVAGNTALPPFYISAGTGDIGYQSSVSFAGKPGLAVSYFEHMGRQDWFGWSIELHQFLKWCTQKEANQACR